MKVKNVNREEVAIKFNYSLYELQTLGEPFSRRSLSGYYWVSLGTKMTSKTLTLD